MKLKLDMEELEGDFFQGTRLLGIVCPVKDYQFCWLMNNHFPFDLRKNNDIEIQLTKKQRKYYFSVFEHREPHTALVHYVYNNQYEGEYLLPEFRNLDYLWLLKGDMVSDSDLTKLIGQIRSLKPVQLVIELQNLKIKNKAHLIF